MRNTRAGVRVPPAAFRFPSRTHWSGYVGRSRRVTLRMLSQLTWHVPGGIGNPLTSWNSRLRNRRCLKLKRIWWGSSGWRLRSDAPKKTLPFVSWARLTLGGACEIRGYRFCGFTVSEFTWNVIGKCWVVLRSMFVFTERVNGQNEEGGSDVNLATLNFKCRTNFLCEHLFNAKGESTCVASFLATNKQLFYHNNF